MSKTLFLLIPFHVLVYKNRLIGYNESEEALGELQKIYEDMVESLGRLRLVNKLTEDEVTDILKVSAEVVDKVAGKYEKVRKVLGDILREQAYELPTDRLIRQGAWDMCIGLLKDGVISMAEAAKRLSMTEEELKAKMS